MIVLSGPDVLIVKHGHFGKLFRSYRKFSTSIKSVGISDSNLADGILSLDRLVRNAYRIEMRGESMPEKRSGDILSIERRQSVIS